MQVRHLIQIEADFEREKRLAEEAERKKPLPTLIFNHDSQRTQSNQSGLTNSL